MSTQLKYFSIADIKIAVESEMPFEITDRYRAFEIAPCPFDTTIHLRWADGIDFSNYVMTYQGKNYDILCHGTESVRIKYDFPTKQTISWYLHTSKACPQESTVYICRNWKNNLHALNPLFFFELSRFLVDYNAMILHSSLIACKGKGIIFTAPSGVGKSTQADLWAKYMEADILNGDRSILRHTTEFLAYGSPYAGSSEIYRNERVPVTAIVVLRQAKENKIRRLPIKEAYLCLLSEMSICRWDKQVVTRQSDWLLELLKEIPVYRLDCLPNREAVELLSNTLGGI